MWCLVHGRKAGMTVAAANDWTALIRSILSLERISCISSLPMGTTESPSRVSWSPLTMTGRIQAIGISIYAERTCTFSLPLLKMEGMFLVRTVVNISLTIPSLLIVDSTRSGKRMPDALSKTVPIWCAVINKAYLVRHEGLLEDTEKNTWKEHGELFCPPWVSGSEWDEIHQRLDLWAKRLLVSYHL